MTLVIAVWWWLQGAVWSETGPQGWFIIIVLAVVEHVASSASPLCRHSARGQIALLWPLQTLTIIALSVLFLNERMTPVQ